MVHPRSFGTFPRKLGLYAIRERVLPLEQAVRSASGLPADILRLPERGYLRAGYFADIAVFDPANILDMATFDKPFEPPVGIPWVIVNGAVAVKNGEPTKTLSGRALRHRSALADAAGGE
jgi:N-acyl-D-amino-acid deacylase